MRDRERARESERERESERRGDLQKAVLQDAYDIVPRLAVRFRRRLVREEVHAGQTGGIGETRGDRRRQEETGEEEERMN